MCATRELAQAAAGDRVCDYGGGDDHLRTDQVIVGSAVVVAAMRPLLEIYAKSSKTK
jgi:hypothetical protein